MNTLSTIPISALDAGTKLPACAIIAMRATWRIYVDFPAMFGPVIMAHLLSEQSSSVSFGTNGSPSSIFSTTGCLPSVIRITGDAEICGHE